MKKQLSSIDLHFLLKELKALEGSRIGKIYQPEKESIIFSLHKANMGKKLLKIVVGRSISIIESKEDYGETLGFGMLLRKHLDGGFLEHIEQLKPERIIKLEFKIKDTAKFLFIEFFGKGNTILCDAHNVIINALEHHDFRERSIKPKLKYVYPVMNYNLFGVSENEMQQMLNNSKKESVIVSLATGLGMGGLYSEEVCLLSGIDKNIKPCEANKKIISEMLASIKKIINHETAAMVILNENNSPADFTPFEFQFYSNKQKKRFESFNDAVNHFYLQFREVKETEHDKKLASLQRIIEQQKEAIESMRKEEREVRQKAEMIYQNYNAVKEALDEINKASKKYSWKEIKEKLKGHRMIKEVNERDRKIVVEIGD